MRRLSGSVGIVFYILSMTLFVGQAQSQSIPKPGEQFTAITNDAMWTWYAEPKSVYYEGKHKRTYMTWTLRSGKKGIGYYDHDTKDTVTMLTPNMPYGGDDHNHPAIIMRPDGRLIIFCTGHDGTEVTEYITKNPEDITSWDGPYYPGKNSWFCYPNAMFLKNEADSGRFYLFFRDSLQEPWFTTSDDWGKTWKNPRYHLFHVSTYPNSAYKPYVKYVCDDKSEIHAVIERQNREGNSAEKPVYFAKYKNGVWYAANGRQIATMAQLPLLDTQLDTIFYANRFGCSNTCYDVALDANNNPVIVMDMFKGTDVNIYWYMRWTGTQWFKKPIVNSGAYRGAQSGFAAGITLDHENPSNVYLCRQLLNPAAKPFNMFDTSYTNYKTNLAATAWTTVAAVHELEKWTTKDGGATWDTMAITRNSTNKNFLPCVPRHHKAGNKVEVIWLNGVYTSMSPDGYNAACRMYPFNETVSTRPDLRTVSGDQKVGLSVENGIIRLALVKPSTSTLKLFGIDGRQIADLTSAIRTMTAGQAKVALRVPNGAYVVRLTDGTRSFVKTVMISK
jgi:hypothetical protein